jgi:hypothetical protein
MTVIELGALGEFISSIAVVITVVYLAMQIRQTRQGLDANTTAILSANEISGNENTLRHLERLYSDEKLADIVGRGLRDLGQLQVNRYLRSTRSATPGYNYIR